MQCAENELRDLTTTLWGSVLGLELRHDDEVMNPVNQDHTVAASVQITGDWEGALAIFCPAPLARQVSAVMFDTTPDETSNESIQDAMGELANIIGGGVKALHPGECHLSLPTVADGTVFSLRVRGSKVVSEVGFDCEGHSFKVTLLARDRQDDLSHRDPEIRVQGGDLRVIGG